jgi:LPXTG-site transpeptidase (sortase) family protein
MPRNTLKAIFAISVVTLIAVIASYLIVTESATVGDVGLIEASLSEPALPATSAPDPQPTVVPPPDAEDESPSVPVRPGILPDLPAGDPILPVGLRLSSIDVDAPIVPTGVDQRTGQMDVPGNVRDVAWYEFGSVPGEEGSAVLAAHVDLASQGPGVFFNLRTVDAGDIVEVSFSDGSASVFRVEARTVYQKDELPLDTIFAREGAPVLTLITCGGGFSESSGSYDSNVVVYAVPIPDRDLGLAG